MHSHMERMSQKLRVRSRSAPVAGLARVFLDVQGKEMQRGFRCGLIGRERSFLVFRLLPFSTLADVFCRAPSIHPQLNERKR